MVCAWVDVCKAYMYDSVDHRVLLFALQMHKFLVTLINVIMKVVKGTSTGLVAYTKTGKETSSPIHLKKALLQGDSLCPRLFTIYVNPLAWKIRTMKGYALSKPIQLKITQLIFIDDTTLFTENKRELYPALKEVKLCLKDLNSSLDNGKCAVMTVKRGELHHNQALQLDDTTTIRAVQEDLPCIQVPWDQRTCTSRLKTHERRDSQRIPPKGVANLVIPTVRQVQGASYSYLCSASPDIPHADYTLACERREKAGQNANKNPQRRKSKAPSVLKRVAVLPQNKRRTWP